MKQIKNRWENNMKQIIVNWWKNNMKQIIALEKSDDYSCHRNDRKIGRKII